MSFVKYADKWHLVDETAAPEQLPQALHMDPRRLKVMTVQCCNARPPVGMRVFDAPIDSATTCTGD